MHSNQKVTQFGSIIKLYYLSITRKWERFFESANYYMCFFNNMIEDILYIAENAPDNMKNEFISNWKSEYNFHNIHKSKFYIPTAPAQLKPEFVCTDEASRKVYNSKKTSMCESTLHLLSLIHYVIKFTKNPGKSMVYVNLYHQKQFIMPESQVNSLPICIESYYLLRYNYPLKALSILYKVYFHTSHMLICDDIDIALIILCCKYVVILVDFCIEHRYRISRFRYNNYKYEQFIDQSVKELLKMIKVDATEGRNNIVASSSSRS